MTYQRTSPSGFAMIPNSAYYKGKLDPFAYAVYGALNHHADKDGICFPSQEVIAKNLNTSRPTVSDRIKVLESLNMVRKEKTWNALTGRWKSNTYRIIDEKYWNTDVNQVDTNRDQIGKPPLHDRVKEVDHNNNQNKQEKLMKSTAARKSVPVMPTEEWENKLSIIEKNKSPKKYESRVVDGIPQLIPIDDDP